MAASPIASPTSPTTPASPTNTLASPSGSPNSPSSPSFPKNKYCCPFPFSGSKRVDAGTAYRLITKEDCCAFREFADNVDDFTVQVNRDGIIVWDKKVKGEPLNQVKVFGTFECKPEVLYAVLQDPAYRVTWDEQREEGWPICKLDDRQDISYYAAKSPVSGVSAREFLTQRAWHETGTGEYVIFNTAVTHTTIPDGGKDGRVRAVSKVTGYLIQPYGDGGCSLVYTTQTDLQGWIPSFVMNFITTKFAPSVIEKMRKVSKGYVEWVESQPDHAVTWALGGKCGPSEWDTPCENKTQALAQQIWSKQSTKK